MWNLNAAYNEYNGRRDYIRLNYTRGKWMNILVSDTNVDVDSNTASTSAPRSTTNRGNSRSRKTCVTTAVVGIAFVLLLLGVSCVPLILYFVEKDQYKYYKADASITFQGTYNESLGDLSTQISIDFQQDFCQVMEQTQANKFKETYNGCLVTQINNGSIFVAFTMYYNAKVKVKPDEVKTEITINLKTNLTRTFSSKFNITIDVNSLTVSLLQTGESDYKSGTSDSRFQTSLLTSTTKGTTSTLVTTTSSNEDNATTSDVTTVLSDTITSDTPTATNTASPEAITTDTPTTTTTAETTTSDTPASKTTAPPGTTTTDALASTTAAPLETTTTDTQTTTTTAFSETTTTDTPTTTTTAKTTTSDTPASTTTAPPGTTTTDAPASTTAAPLETTTTDTQTTTTTASPEITTTDTSTTTTTAKTTTSDTPASTTTAPPGTTIIDPPASTTTASPETTTTTTTSLPEITTTETPITTSTAETTTSYTPASTTTAPPETNNTSPETISDATIYHSSTTTTFIVTSLDNDTTTAATTATTTIAAQPFAVVVMKNSIGEIGKQAYIPCTINITSGDWAIIYIYQTNNDSIEPKIATVSKNGTKTVFTSDPLLIPTFNISGSQIEAVVTFNFSNYDYSSCSVRFYRFICSVAMNSGSTFNASAEFNLIAPLIQPTVTLHRTRYMVNETANISLAAIDATCNATKDRSSDIAFIIAMRIQNVSGHDIDSFADVNSYNVSTETCGELVFIHWSDVFIDRGDMNGSSLTCYVQAASDKIVTSNNITLTFLEQQMSP